MSLDARSFDFRWGAKQRDSDRIIIRVPLCVRTPVIIQFGVSYLQTEVGARWVQIELCKPFCAYFFAEYIQLDVVPKYRP